MKTNRLFAFSLPVLAALFVMMPHPRPVAAPHVQPAAGAESVPCSDSGQAKASVSASPVERLKTVNSPYPYSIEMRGITESNWISQDDMILWEANQLQVFHRKTQQTTPIAGTSSVFSPKHTAIVSLSPDSHWLVWAGGEDGHCTWEAITTDGTEHRQWSRDECIGTPAIAWMQDSIHWVELRCPETQIDARTWYPHSDNLRARVYSVTTPSIEDYPLRLEIPDRTFILTDNGSADCEFVFTQDGHAWLSKNWSFAPTPQTLKLASREDVYELVPGPQVWTLHKSFVYPVSDSKRWMFDAPRRSPDGNWIAWRNFAPTGKDKLRLMISRPDGSEMQELYQSDTTSGVEPQWSPDSRQIAFDNGQEGIVTLKIDSFVDQTPSCSPGKAVARALAPGKFPVAHPGSLLAGRPHRLAVSRVHW